MLSPWPSWPEALVPKETTQPSEVTTSTHMGPHDARTALRLEKAAHSTCQRCETVANPNAPKTHTKKKTLPLKARSLAS